MVAYVEFRYNKVVYTYCVHAKASFLFSRQRNTITETKGVAIMNIHMSDQALEWYKKELHLENGDNIKFQVRYGGYSTVQKGFSLGIVKEDPDQPVATVEKDGITFFVEEKDAWYFDNHDLHIKFDEKLNEPKFDYE